VALVMMVKVNDSKGNMKTIRHVKKILKLLGN
jgi:hypothetical protein